MKDPKDPSTTSDAWDYMIPVWRKVASVLGGTEAMRVAGRAYLPQHPRESDDFYSARLQSATLFNVAKSTLEGWVGRPFSERIRKSDDLKEELKDVLDDVDLEGNNVDVFCRNWFEAGLSKSFAHVLVEFPRIDNTEQRTLAHDREEGLRPYWVDVPPERVIAAHSTKINGKEILTHVRILEESVEQVGFTERTVQRIREMNWMGNSKPVAVRLWKMVDEKGKKKEWVVEDEWEMLGMDQIPLVTFYADREALMMGTPPLMDLIDLNIRHWQSSSEQNVALTVARFPLLAATGVKDISNLTVGPNKLLYAREADAKFHYVEHTGQAIEAGRKDILDLEEQMASYGDTFLKRRPGSQTATARAIDSAEATSPLQDVTLRFQDAVAQALWLTAKWMRIENPGTLEVTTDFGPEVTDGADLTALVETRRSRDISRKAYLTELQRRGVLSSEYDIEKDLEALSEEAHAVLARAGIDIDPEGGEDEESSEK